MFGNKFTRLLAGTVLTMGLVANVAGIGAASAASLTPTYTTQLATEGNTSMAAGNQLTVQGTSFGQNEEISFWINVPDGTQVPKGSLGQTNTTMTGNVIALDSIASTDDNGAFTYTIDTTGLPSGSYSLVAHGLSSQVEQILDFTISGSSAPAPLMSEGSTTMAAGTPLTLHGSFYKPNESISLWINVPEGTALDSDSLGQNDTKVDGNVVQLYNMPGTDASGRFTYTVNTTGLPAGNYSIVAHGVDSGIENVLSFIIN